METSEFNPSVKLTVDGMYEKFMFYYTLAFDKFIPKKYQFKNKEPLMNQDLKKAIRAKMLSWKAFAANNWSIDKKRSLF